MNYDLQVIKISFQLICFSCGCTPELSSVETLECSHNLQTCDGDMSLCIFNCKGCSVISYHTTCTLDSLLRVFTSTAGRQLRWLKRSYCVWAISNQILHMPLVKKNRFLNSKLERRKWKRSKEIPHLHSQKFKFGIVILCFLSHKREGKHSYHQ